MVSFIAVVTFILSHMLFNKCRGMTVFVKSTLKQLPVLSLD